MSDGNGVELSVVIPVYRDPDGIAAAVADWTEALDALGADYELLVYDDGSDDETPEVLRLHAAKHPRVFVRQHENRGHGPSIRRGYEEAVGEWVMQADGDNEIPARHFEALWSRRRDYDVLVGRRDASTQSLARRIVSYASYLTVRALFGPGARDVNVPFRLMRGDALRTLVPLIPEHAFAPNVILTGLFARHGARLYEEPVPTRPRQARPSSLRGARLWRGAVRSFWESIRVAATPKAS